MKRIIIAIISVVLLVACENSKKQPINTEMKENNVITGNNSIENRTNYDTTEYETNKKGINVHKKSDNMRGFDPASEDDMDDNGMSRYFDNNDEEGWD